MSLLKSFVEPETTDSSGTSESDEEMLSPAEMDEGTPLPDKDSTTPEMYAASYPASCARVEEDALAFLANGQLPVINVPTIRDLGKQDLRTFLRLGQKRFRNVRQYALFLVAFTDYITCVCNNGYLFDLFKSEDDKVRKLPALLACLDTQWCRFFHFLTPHDMPIEQLRSVITLFHNATKGLKVAVYKECFWKSICKSEVLLLRAPYEGFQAKEAYWRAKEEAKLCKETKASSIALCVVRSEDKDVKLKSVGAPSEAEVKPVTPKPKKWAYDITRYMLPKGTEVVPVLSQTSQVVPTLSLAEMENILEEHKLVVKKLLKETDSIMASSLDVLQKSSKDNKPEQDIKAPHLNLKQAEIAPLKENTYKDDAVPTTKIFADDAVPKPQISLVSMNRLLASPRKNKEPQVADMAASRNVAAPLPSPSENKHLFDSSSLGVIESIDLCSPVKHPHIEQASSEKKHLFDSSSLGVIESIDLCSSVKRPRIEQSPTSKNLNALEFMMKVARNELIEVPKKLPIKVPKKLNAFEVLMNRAKERKLAANSIL